VSPSTSPRLHPVQSHPHTAHPTRPCASAPRPHCPRAPPLSATHIDLPPTRCAIPPPLHPWPPLWPRPSTPSYDTPTPLTSASSHLAYRLRRRSSPASHARTPTLLAVGRVLHPMPTTTWTTSARRRGRRRACKHCPGCLLFARRSASHRKECIALDSLRLLQAFGATLASRVETTRSKRAEAR